MALIDKLRKRFGVLQARPLSEFSMSLDEGELSLVGYDNNEVELETPYFVVSRDHSMVQYWLSLASLNQYLVNLAAIKRSWDEEKDHWKKEHHEAVKEVKRLERETAELLIQANDARERGQPEMVVAQLIRSFEEKRVSLRYAKGIAASSPPIQPSNDLRNLLFFSTGVQLTLGMISRSVRDEKRRLVEKFGSVPKFNEWSYDRNTKIVMHWR